jgi:cytochrome c
MKTRLILAALASATLVTSAFADGKALYLEKTCVACHGKDAKKPLTPEYPKLAGQNAKYAERKCWTSRVARATTAIPRR